MKEKINGDIEEIKFFVDNFNYEEPHFMFLAKLTADVIRIVGRDINKDMNEKKDSGAESYLGADAVKVAIKGLRYIADVIENAARIYSKEKEAKN